jgi:hypothetical protein
MTGSQSSIVGRFFWRISDVTKRFALLTSLILTCALIAFAFGPVDGTWTAATTSSGAPQILSLQTNGAILTGTADGVGVSNGKVEGTTIWFSSVRGGVAYSYKGAAAGNQLKLYETRADGSNPRALVFNHN